MQEYTALIKYIQMGKENDTDWFQIESNKEGTVWTGKVWYVYEMKKYEVSKSAVYPSSLRFARIFLLLHGTRN